MAASAAEAGADPTPPTPSRFAGMSSWRTSGGCRSGGRRTAGDRLVRAAVEGRDRDKRDPPREFRLVGRERSALEEGRTASHPLPGRAAPLALESLAAAAEERRGSRSGRERILSALAAAAEAEGVAGREPRARRRAWLLVEAGAGSSVPLSARSALPHRKEGRRGGGSGAHHSRREEVGEREEEREREGCRSRRRLRVFRRRRWERRRNGEEGRKGAGFISRISLESRCTAAARLSSLGV